MKTIVITGALCAAIGAVGKSWLHISVCASEWNEVLEYNGTTYSKRT